MNLQERALNPYREIAQAMKVSDMIHTNHGSCFITQIGSKETSVMFYNYLLWEIKEAFVEILDEILLDESTGFRIQPRPQSLQEGICYPSG